MAADDVSAKIQNLKIKESKDINILLLGETGVGKSTFINAIANYLHFKSFKKALKAEDLLILIPSIITVTNESMEQQIIKFGSDSNEYQEIGDAGTQDVKTYVFPIGEGKTRMRLIDSPGMGDPRGIKQDDINCENILAYLAQLQELHAICFLMNPTTTRKTIYFEYCVKQILSRLEKSASKNIIFIFTNTRGRNYSPGDTLPCLKRVIDEIKAQPPYVEIPAKDNIFSLDNEAFRYLIAMKNGIQFDDNIRERFIESWNISTKECLRLISYIVGDASRDGLKPHQLANTVSINEARKVIVQLSQPLADITQLIHDNIRILDKHKNNLRIENQSLDDLKKKLYMPIIDLEVTQLTQPVTVCTSRKCADLVQVGEVRKWHYRQRCHDPCYLTNVTKEIIGDTNLMQCAAMNGTRTCLKCTCDFTVHMHVYYMTKTVDKKIEDNVVKNNINKKEEALRESERLIKQIDQRKTELEHERAIIIKSTAQFAHFLQHNAISPFNDAYKGYIEYLISREEGLGRNGDWEIIHNLRHLLLQYEQVKESFDNSLKMEQQLGLQSVDSVTAQSVLNTIFSLYQLKHTGKKIKELVKKQKSSRNSEYDHTCEYIHPKASDLSQTEGKKDKSKKDKKKDSKTDDETKKKDKKKDSKTDDETKKKDKKKDSKTDDEKKRRDKNKDGKSTDDERKFKQYPQNRNFQPHQRNRFSNQNQPNPNPTWREPPPPYHEARQPQHAQQYHASSNPVKHGESNVVVKVELTQPGKNPKHAGGDHHNQQGRQPNMGPGSYDRYGSNYNYPPAAQHYPPSQEPYAPPYDPYYRSPQQPYHGPPHSPYQGPAQGQYQGPPQGPYHGPPSNQYHGYQDPHYGPPQGQFSGPPQQRPYQKQYAGPPHYNQGNRGRGFKNRGGGGGGNTRSKSNQRQRGGQSGKSGNERSSKSSSDSDSSD